jgi:DNA-binding transcriptional MerR regulator
VNIDELASAARTSTRNIRYYQSEGLLPPPTQVGRVADYGAEHRERLEAIVRLAARGYGLQAIREVLGSHAAGGTIAELIGLDGQLDRVRARVQRSRDEMHKLYGLTGRSLQTASEAGWLIDLGGDQFEVTGEAQLVICHELRALGIPLTRSLPLMAELHAVLEPVADKAVHAIAKEVWRPYVEQGLPSRRTSAVSATLTSLRSVSSRAVAVAWQASLEAALERSTRRAAARRRDSGQTSGQTTDDKPARTSADQGPRKAAVTRRKADQPGRRRTPKSAS